MHRGGEVDKITRKRERKREREREREKKWKEEVEKIEEGYDEMRFGMILHGVM